VPGVKAAATKPTQAALDLDLGNLAEVNRVAVNPGHITHVRLTGVRRMGGRKMEIHFVSGTIVTMNFDEEPDANEMFAQILGAMGFVVTMEEPESPSE
jgi:hypothetical protein